MPPRDAWQGRIELALGRGMQPLVEAVLSRWFTAGFRAAQPAKVERVRQMLLETDARGYAACAAAIRDMDLREDLKSIIATTLVIGGTSDPATPPAQAELINSSIQGSKLVMLEAAHLSNIERAPEFTATLLDFLAAEAIAP
jgi:3-oxoadipate enol-lactonase